MRMRHVAAVASVAIASFPALSGAALIDVTHPLTSTQVNGAIFETIDFGGAGTGNLQPFVRMQKNGTEQGYNTSGRPTAFDETTSGNFTHDLRIADVGLVQVDSVMYREFW